MELPASAIVEMSMSAGSWVQQLGIPLQGIDALPSPTPLLQLRAIGFGALRRGTFCRSFSGLHSATPSFTCALSMRSVPLSLNTRP